MCFKGCRRELSTEFGVMRELRCGFVMTWTRFCCVWACFLVTWMLFLVTCGRFSPGFRYIIGSELHRNGYSFRKFPVLLPVFLGAFCRKNSLSSLLGVLFDFISLFIWIVFVLLQLMSGLINKWLLRVFYCLFIALFDFYLIFADFARFGCL